MNAADRQVRARLEALLDAAERSGGRLSFEDVRELAHLYRLSLGATCGVAIARQRSRGVALSQCVVRARLYPSAGDAARREAQVGRFYFARFPATLAATAWLQGLVAIVLLAGALTGATIVAQNPANIYAAIPSAMYPADDLERLVSSRADREKFLARKPVAFGIKSVFSASLFVHNTGIGFLAFATGILAGIPTIILVFYNGITLGAFAWIFSRDAAWPIFWAWLLPHAIPELLAITLCSTAGLLIANAVLAPGRRGIAAALRDAVDSRARIGDRFGAAFHRRGRDRKLPAAIDRSRPPRDLPPPRSPSHRSSLTYGTCIGSPRGCPRSTSDGSSQKRGLTNCKVAIQHRRGDARGIEVERLRAERRDARQRGLAFRREVLQCEAPIQPLARDRQDRARRVRRACDRASPPASRQ